MKSRSQIVTSVEKEINERLAFDHRFCAEHRYLAPKVTATDIAWFVGFEYWMPQDAKDSLDLRDSDNSALTVNVDDAPRATHASDDAQLIGPDGKFTQQSAQDMASIVACQWQELEAAGFKLNNIHVSEYIPCMLVGRQYSHLIRFLSLVQPHVSANTANADEPSRSPQFRYRNISIPRRSSDLLVLQIEAVQQLLLGDRDKRIILEALIDPDTDLHRKYAYHTIYGDVDAPRDEDELQVMRERRVIHAERELSWAAELAYLVQIGWLWRQHISENVMIQSRLDVAIATAERHLS
ncbi:hypothetical protein GGI24_006815 [Coemansia furcata]|nr:hypothetical protein GGI24_006815 [Coemansia furcata]